MRHLILLPLAALLLTACSPDSPRISGLYSVERDIAQTRIDRIAFCLQARFEHQPGQEAASDAQQVQAQDGSWFLFRRRAEDKSVWEIRLTRVGPERTEIEIDAAPLVFGPEHANDQLANLVHDCAEGGAAKPKPKRR